MISNVFWCPSRSQASSIPGLRCGGWWEGGAGPRGCAGPRRGSWQSASRGSPRGCSPWTLLQLTAPPHTLTQRSTACLPLPHCHLCIKGSGRLASLHLTHFSLSVEDQLMLTSSRQPSLIQLQPSRTARATFRTHFKLKKKKKEIIRCLSETLV